MHLQVPLFDATAAPVLVASGVERIWLAPVLLGAAPETDDDAIASVVRSEERAPHLFTLRPDGIELWSPACLGGGQSTPGGPRLTASRVLPFDYEVYPFAIDSSMGVVVSVTTGFTAFTSTRSARGAFRLETPVRL
jgi:hypothetical protein